MDYLRKAVTKSVTCLQTLLLIGMFGCGDSVNTMAVSDQKSDEVGAIVSADSEPRSDEDDLTNAMAQAAAAIDYESAEDIGLMARFHFATHTKDFDMAREFYRKLGYTTGVGGFPLTNTHQMARALGMFDVCQYELAKGEVISLPASPHSANIDPFLSNERGYAGSRCT